jgi:hypothetical protein
MYGGSMCGATAMTAPMMARGQRRYTRFVFCSAHDSLRGQRGHSSSIELRVFKLYFKLVSNIPDGLSAFRIIMASACVGGTFAFRRTLQNSQRRP